MRQVLAGPPILYHGDRVKTRRFDYRWSMIMSVYERTDADDERAGKDTGVERSDHRRGDRGGCGRAGGRSERHAW